MGIRSASHSVSLKSKSGSHCTGAPRRASCCSRCANNNAQASQAQLNWRVFTSTKCRWPGASSAPQSAQRSTADPAGTGAASEVEARRSSTNQCLQRNEGRGCSGSSISIAAPPAPSQNRLLDCPRDAVPLPARRNPNSQQFDTPEFVHRPLHSNLEGIRMKSVEAAGRRRDRRGRRSAPLPRPITPPSAPAPRRETREPPLRAASQTPPSPGLPMLPVEQSAARSHGHVPSSVLTLRSEHRRMTRL